MKNTHGANNTVLTHDDGKDNNMHPKVHKQQDSKPIM
jgi:hypothetical protein